MSKESAQIIKYFLHEKKLTIAEFATLIDISRWSVYKYLDGLPIHRKIAKRIEQKILERYRVFIAHETLLD